MTEAVAAGSPDRAYKDGGEPELRAGGPSAVAPAEPSDSTLRLAHRISIDYTIRFLTLLRSLGPGDLVDTLVSLALIQANVGHIDNPIGAPADGIRADGAVPDALRRPVSVLALADTLGLPYETTRRRLAQLAAAGYCTRVPGGVITPVATDGPGHDAVRRANLANLQRMFRTLRQAGVSLD
jgi:hypothetical protein